MRLAKRCPIVGLALMTLFAVRGAQLPLRQYTTADGLANNAVNSIASDARGFLWLATSEGLSRFDGFTFANQSRNTGLPHSMIFQVLAGSHGDYWLGTPAGVVRFRPDLPRSSPDRMLTLKPNGKPASTYVTSLLEDRKGRLWCGTPAGLFAVDNDASGKPKIAEVQIGLPNVADGDSDVSALTEDSEGALWIGTTEGTLYRRLQDGTIQRYGANDKSPERQIATLHADSKGRIWLGRGHSLYRSIAAEHPGANGFEKLSGREGLPEGLVFDIFESREGDVWVGIYRFLAQFPADGSPPRVWGKESGLPSRGIGAIAQDRDGNLWLGTGDVGVFKLAAGGTLRYSADDGIGVDGVISIGETRRGELYFGGRLESEGFRVATPSMNRFRAIAPRVPNNVTYFGWRPARVVLQDRTGEWWIATSQGLCRYPRLENPLELGSTMPKAVYTTRDGLPGDVIIRLFEDSHGNIWIGPQANKFAYWSKSEQKFITIASGHVGYAAAFIEDKAGNIWIGDEEGRLWRVTDGRATEVPGPARRAVIQDLLVDRAGRLWVATNGQGLLRFDDPAAAAPHFRQYGYADGLSSLGVLSLGEDRDGFLYVGSGSGIDRLHPDQVHVRHYTSADGIAPGQVIAAYRDRAGVMWFGSNHGLTRLIPQSGAVRKPPPVWITGLSIAGRPVLVSDAGESSLRSIQVQPGQEEMQFDFVGLSYAAGDVLRYQYRLGNDEWSTSIDSRSVHYGALAPGRHQFAVRAVNSNGDTSLTPATVEFSVIAPLWSRTWFQALLIVLAITGSVLVHRVRSARLLEIARVRMRIATDLHDDIGSSLSQIAILSEVAHHRAAGGKSDEPVERIGVLSRELLDSIGDIVWAIQPHKDHLSDLNQRMRRFAADVLSARNMAMHWSVGDMSRDLALNAELRQQVYLIFKESINNIAQHSGATEARITLRVADRRLDLEVSDNGRGIEGSGHDGNGLKSMKLRAARLGGELDVRSVPGEGATILLRTPLPQQVVAFWNFRSKVKNDPSRHH